MNSVQQESVVEEDRAAEVADAVLEFLGRLRRLRGEAATLPEGGVLASLQGDGRGPREWHGQIRMLRTLHHHGPMTMRDLAQHMDVAPPTVTAMTKRLLDQHFIERVRDVSDSRVFWIEISDRGREAITAFHAARVAHIRGLISRFDAGEQIEIQRAVEILSRVLIDQTAPLDIPLPCARAGRHGG